MNAFAFGEKVAAGRNRFMESIGRAMLGSTATQPKGALASLMQTPSQAGYRAALSARHRFPREIADVKFNSGRNPTTGNTTLSWNVNGVPALDRLSKAPMSAAGQAIPSYRRLAMEATRAQAAGDQLRRQLMAGGAAATAAGAGAGAAAMGGAPAPGAEQRGMIKTQAARAFGEKVARNFTDSLAYGGGLLGGLAGAGAGAIGGGLYGAIDPGYDEEGKRKSRLMSALKGMAMGGLGGGAIGAGLGGLGGAATEKGYHVGQQVARAQDSVNRELNGRRAQERAMRELHGLDAPVQSVDPVSRGRLQQLGATA